VTATNIVDRELDWDGCWNVRDLGGLALAEGVIQRGALVRSDSLSHLSADGWEAAVSHGITSIVDLRASREVGLDPDLVPPGIDYRHLPIVDVVHEAEERAFRDRPSWDEAYVLMLDRFRIGFSAAVSAIGEARPGGVAVHCRVGRDRTGIVVALLLELAGVPREEILEDYARSAERLAPAFEHWIATEPDPRRRAQLEWEGSARADLIVHALDHVERRYGGARAYLADARVDDAVARLLR